MIAILIRFRVIISVVFFFIFCKYVFEYSYAVEKNTSDLNIDISCPVINIETVSYPTFSEIDLAKLDREIYSSQDLVININDFDSREKKLKIKYMWNIISNNLNWDDKTTLSIGNGSIENVISENTGFQYNSMENKNIPENVPVELVSIQNKESNTYEYRVPKEEIFFNVGGVSDVGTYHMYQRCFLMYVQENN